VTDAPEPTPAPDEPTPWPSSDPNDDIDATIDLDAIEADLDAVQLALGRLADGNYWNDEVTGAPIPAEVLDADPLVRRA
jgi:RNA polymerase-binding transcription factor DksA